ncbi:PAS domain-containing protein [Desulfofundulus thermocisternus]|uniref:PAS domain-containing protein n=1 Tax=Desulfofundulus thermocisternus TaxID=42471 RepID=UPI00217E4F70|nr:PAS domain-containing protein [Desulfofundulus thermocisternus]MCS5696414.1 PAS domain-containing protein [Desulfofundulus thermocisternus]
MKKSLTVNSAWLMFIMLFFLTIITMLFVVEFRFLKGIMNDYEETIRQVAVNKTSFFLNNLRGVTEGAARKLNGRPDRNAALKELPLFDHRITGAYILDATGRVVARTGIPPGDLPLEKFRSQPPRQGSRVLGVHAGDGAQTVVTVVTPLGKEWLALDFSIMDFQQELSQEFLGNTCKVAVFAGGKNPVVWPFERELLDQFSGREEKFYAGQLTYDVSSVTVGDPPWQLYFFLRENNFDTYRIITIMLLLFALYCCLYQFLVELWGVNSARTYFENIDFNIFNHVHEGVIISNNAGRVLFANQAAHEIFSAKGPLKGAKLREILGHIGDAPGEKNRYGTLTLKTADRLLEAIHSPIVKKGKVLGALTVIGAGGREEETCGRVLSRLMEVLPQGAVYVDRNHRVVQANLMARCYLGNLETGISIDAVDPELAGFIYRNMGSRSVKRVHLNSRQLDGEVIFVYDEEGIYAGTLVLLEASGQEVYPASTPEQAGAKTG